MSEIQEMNEELEWNITELSELKEEVDEPLAKRSPIGNDALTPKQLDIKEKDKDRKDKRYFTAFKLIIGCLGFLGAIYVIDVVSSAVLNKSTSDITESIIEVVKTLLFTLSGYLFARKENGD